VSGKSNNNNNSNMRRRVVIVTGSGKGIGKAIAIEFAKAGYYVMINDFVQEEELKRTAEEISKLVAGDKENNNNKVAYLVGDISQEQISISLIEETIKRFGRIDVLINNAEIAEKPTMKKTATPTANEITTTSTSNSTDSFHKQISPYFTLEEYEIADLYLKGVYLCIREVVKQMVIEVPSKTKKEDGNDDVDNNNNKRGKKSIYSIINISSPYQSIPKPEADEYTFSMSGVDPFTSSRAGVKSLTKTIALQLAEKGIRVNAIAPGLIATDRINKELLEKEEKSREEKEKEIPLHRIGEPEEIAKIALFLASDDASYITGNMIYVDGGLSLSRSNYFLESKLEQD
jgi:glucose 1-dehydrogenase